jgi:thioredoxin reductase (NADPH)
VVADDDPRERTVVAEELERRYGDDYAVLHCAVDEAGVTLERTRADDEQVALVLAAEEAGCAVLAGVHAVFPAARRGLLIPWLGWADETRRETVLHAMARGWIDLYVIRPVGRRDEVFHRTISELLQESARQRGEGPSGARVVADPGSPRGHELRSTLSALGIPHLVSDAEPGATPVVELADGRRLEDPSSAALAVALGFPTELAEGEADVVIVGAGPAGLAAAVYASSEGLSTVVLDGGAVGGQAGSSSLIRNYLGFPRGLGGGELAQRAYQQAWLFGARFRLTERVVALEPRGDRIAVRAADGAEVLARAVVLATGVEYRRLDAPGVTEREGAGVYYGASASEAFGLAGEDAYVVGGGNSAGQAALHLARYARRVTLLVRGPTLATSMSQYLIDALDEAPNAEVRYGTSVAAAEGEGRLERLVLRDADGDAAVPAAALFVLIGAHPHTDWLPAEIERDEWGYVITGPELETTLPGVFAAGDVRSRSVKRVAAAAGSGALAVSGIHGYLARRKEEARPARG